MELVKVKKPTIREKEHDIVFVFNKTYEEGLINHGLCLCCNDYISFNECFQLCNFWEGIQEGMVNPLGIIDISDIIDINTLNTWCLGENIFAKRARDKFIELNSSDEVFSFEKVKQAIVEDTIQYSKEIVDNGFKQLSVQPDNNIEVLNAVCEECIDLCSEGVKRKIK